MSDQRAEQEPLKIFRPAATIPEFYANYIGVHWTGMDVRFRFGQAVPITEQQGDTTKFGVEERVGVTLSWFEVKMLRDMTTDLVRRYEAVNGEIKAGSKI